MNIKILLVAVIGAIFLSGTPAIAQQIARQGVALTTGEADLAAETLARGLDSTDWPSWHRETEPVSVTRSLLGNVAAKSGMAAAPRLDGPGLDRTRISESRHYYVDTDGAALGRGIELPLTAPGAVIRISVPEDQALTLDAVRLVFDGRAVPARDFAETSALGRDLRASGWSVPENTVAFRLDRRVRAGVLDVSVDGLDSRRAALVHVFEPDSPYVARLTLNRQAFLAGQRIAADFEVRGPTARRVPAGAALALVDPDGQRSASMRRSAGGWEITASARSGQPPGALHEIHAVVETRIDGLEIRRNLTHAVAIAPALARLTGEARVTGDRELSIVVPVETAVEGRFQVRATLYTGGADGDARPVTLAESAAVLAPGTGALALRFDTAGLTGPFELRDLMLFDQGRMLLLERRARALQISPGR